MKSYFPHIFKSIIAIGIAYACVIMPIFMAYKVIYKSETEIENCQQLLLKLDSLKNK